MGLRVYNGGTFDLFHWGHVEMLRRCKELAGDGELIVAVNTDEFVERYKGKRPVMDLGERIAVVESCRWVDEVVVNYGDEDSRPVILDARADLVVTGSDWIGRDYMKQMSFTQEWLEKNNVGVAFLTYSAGISTTAIRRRLTVE